LVAFDSDALTSLQAFYTISTPLYAKIPGLTYGAIVSSVTRASLLVAHCKEIGTPYMSSDQPQPTPLELTQKSLNTEKPLGSNVDFQLGRYSSQTACNFKFFTRRKRDLALLRSLASPRFTHADLDRSASYYLRAVSISNADIVTLVFDANLTTRSNQVELPVSQLDSPYFGFGADDLKALAIEF
jgi:hypothetical protein